MYMQASQPGPGLEPAIVLKKLRERVAKLSKNRDKWRLAAKRYKAKFEAVTQLPVSTTKPAAKIAKDIRHGVHTKMTKTRRLASHFTAKAMWRIVKFNVLSRVSAKRTSTAVLAGFSVSINSLCSYG